MDVTERNQIVEKYMPLARAIALEVYFQGGNPFNLTKEEIIAEGYYWLVVAVDRRAQVKKTLAGWIGGFLRNRLGRARSKLPKKVTHEKTNASERFFERMSSRSQPLDYPEDWQTQALKLIAAAIPSKRGREVVIRRCIKRQSVLEIAKALRIPVRYVVDVVHAGIELIRVHVLEGEGS